MVRSIEETRTERNRVREEYESNSALREAAIDHLQHAIQQVIFILKLILCLSYQLQLPGLKLDDACQS